jgi:hypothetical protein
MTFNKQFAQDSITLADCMDSLIEVLAQLLDEPENPAADADRDGCAVPIAALHSDADRVIHVVVNNQEE